LLAGQRADGCIPARVNAAGRAIYSPGGENKPIADHALDNSSFLASAVCRYVANSGDLEFFRMHEPALRRGMDFIRRSANGPVFNPTENPQCVYGFTDVVKKTGHLLFTSVLYHNGAYWATPLNWLIPVLARRDPAQLLRQRSECLFVVETFGQKNGGAKGPAAEVNKLP